MSRLKIATDKFLIKANNLNSNKYSYNMNTYLGSKNNMEITCPIHGMFLQRPSDHIQGQQCPKCASESGKNKITMKHDEFIKKVKELHSDKLDFTNSIYTSPNSDIEFSCIEHCNLEAKASTLLRGHGCYICSGARLNTQEFIKRAKKLHGDKYSYDKTVYKNTRTKVIINCPIHGDYLQLPSGHLDGRGCSGCAKKGYDKTKSGYLYYLYFPGLDVYKIGITNISIEGRFLLRERKTFIVLGIKYYEDGSKPLKLEQWLIKRYSHLRYTGTTSLTCGNTEIFTLDIRNFIPRQFRKNFDQYINNGLLKLE